MAPCLVVTRRVVADSQAKVGREGACDHRDVESSQVASPQRDHKVFILDAGLRAYAELVGDDLGIRRGEKGPPDRDRRALHGH